MKLSTYLEDSGLTLTQFAVDAGIDISTASRAATGRVIPSPKTMLQIFDATNGAVTANDFIGMTESAA